MIQIELNAIDEKNAGSTHVCRVTEGEKILGELFLSMDQSHGTLDRTVMETGGGEFLDGLVKTAVHQLFWKGIRTISYNKSDIRLGEYFGQYDFGRRETEEEIHFDVEDFIQATRCSHG